MVSIFLSTSKHKSNEESSRSTCFFKGNSLALHISAGSFHLFTGSNEQELANLNEMQPP